MIVLTRKERLVLVVLSVSIAAGSLARYLFRSFPDSQKIFNVANDYHEHLRLDVNRASVDDLKAIPYLGEQLARRIIAYRQQKGHIQGLNELNTIKGVGAFKWQVIKKHLMVRP